MQRIATSTKAVDLYGVGKHGFKDGNLTLGITPTDLEASWCNGVQEELVNLIEIAGLVASGATPNQIVQAIAILQRQQTNTAFTTTGVAPNFVLTPSLPVTAYAANQRFRVNFNVAGSGANAINVSALGAKLLKQYDSTGAKIAAVIAAGQLADIEYDGVDFVILDPLPSTVAAAFQGANQSLSANGYQKLPGGLIFQWVTGTFDQNAAAVITLPCAWTTLMYGGVANKVGAMAVGTTDGALIVRANPTNPLTQINIEIGANGGGVSHAMPFFCFALGK